MGPLRTVSIKTAGALQVPNAATPEAGRNLAATFAIIGGYQPGVSRP